MEIDKEEQRKECLNKAIGRRDYLHNLLKKLKRDYEESCDSVKIWSKKDGNK